MNQKLTSEGFIEGVHPNLYVYDLSGKGGTYIYGILAYSEEDARNLIPCIIYDWEKPCLELPTLETSLGILFQYEHVNKN